MRKKTTRRRAIRIGLSLLNVFFLVATLLFVLQRPHSEAVKQSSVNNSDLSVSANPLDQVASANIAVTVARLSGLPESTAVTNQADSQLAEINIAATNNNIVTKPQVIATGLKSRADIVLYTTRQGDTVAKIAARFGVTSDSIIWSNNLNGNSLAPNQKLLIPPINGVVYTVRKGDTADSLARKFNANKKKIIAFNDAEIGGLRVGERILIPNGNLSSTTPTYYASTVSTGSFPWGSSPIYGYNGYDYGYCTWYVASQVPVPSNWGNAATWSYYAGLSGWNVSSSPAVGAIAQTPYAAGGEGHVAIVEAVKGNMVKISDMNGLAGWGAVGTGWEPISKYPNYITR